jgi:hypothetical protein
MVKIKKRYFNTSNGYIKVLLTDGRVTEEHRFIVEKYLGRKLDRDETVHHCDGRKQHNKIWNLELILRKYHTSHHRKHGETFIDCECVYCKKIFQRKKRHIRNGQTVFFCCREHRNKFYTKNKGKIFYKKR